MPLSPGQSPSANQGINHHQPAPGLSGCLVLQPPPISKMEDSWAAGPSWTTPAKKPAATMEFPREDTPPVPSFDSDPWGTNASATTPTPVDETPLRSTSPPTVPDVPETPSWGAEQAPSWGDEGNKDDVEPDIPLKPPDTDDMAAEDTVTQATATWTLNSPDQPTSSLPSAQTPPGSSVPLPISPTSAVTLNSPEQPALTHNVPDEPTQPLDFGTSSDEPPRDEEEAFASALRVASPRLSLPTSPISPVFSDGGFGGFSAGFSNVEDGNQDPWGAGGSSGHHARDSWGSGGSAIASPVIDDEEEAGEGWGGASFAQSQGVGQITTQESSWEEAQRVMRLQEERLPREKIEKLRNEWMNLAETAMGGKKLENPTQVESEKMESAWSALQDQSRETLRSLATVPEDINTYPTVISSTTTHERHAYALSRPNPDPSTSLLNISLSRRTRRMDNISTESPWLSRSRLGEPEATPDNVAAPAMEENKSKWSFWGRKSTPKPPLVTSGGGVLEVKSPGPDSGRPSSERRSSSIRAPSISISAQGSRSSSPAPGPSQTPTTSVSPHQMATGTVSMDSVGHSSPSGALGTTTPQGPSAVSRFFGRLSRNKSSQNASFDGKDLELSTDDFAFLQEVPSLNDNANIGQEHGIGDLLSMESGRPEEIASLESMLASNPTALAPALAPPPGGRAAFSRTPSSSSQASRIAPPRPSEMDLLGDLDFAHDGMSTSDSASPTNASVKPNSSVFDDLMNGPSNVSTSHTTSYHRPQSPPMSINKSTPSSTLQVPVTPAQRVPAPSQPKIQPLLPSTQMKMSSSFDDFDDFGTPVKPSTSTSIDDFGDFSAFDTPHKPSTPSVPIPTQTTASSQPVIQSPGGHRPTSSVDHSSTMNLLNGASSLKGRRWPAPPSPVAPVLAPPPSNSNTNSSSMQKSSSGFPFLSPPPPPSRPASSQSQMRNMMDDLLDSDMEQPMQLQAPPTSRTSLSPPPQAANRSNTLSPPPMSGQANARPPSIGLGIGQNKPAQPDQKALSTGKGLTASDLSFFDGL